MTRRIAGLNNNTDRSALAARFPDDGHKVAHALGGHVGLSPGDWRIGNAGTHCTVPLPFMQAAQVRLKPGPSCTAALSA